MFTRRFVILGVGCAFAVLLPGAMAASIGQIDTFEDGTTQGWQINILGSGAPLGSPPSEALPKNVPSGGKGGVEDSYLELQSLGTPGPGGRLSVINLDQWAGDYLASGIKAIRMDVNNLGASDLILRLLVADPIPGPPQNLAFSAEPLNVPSGSGWVTITFPIQAMDLTAGLGSVEAALSNVRELRLFHGTDTLFPGEPISARLGVDNIEAIGVSVPDAFSNALQLGCALLSMAGLWHFPRRGRQAAPTTWGTSAATTGKLRRQEELSV